METADTGTVLGGISGDSEESLLTPVGTPRVLEDVVVLSGFGSVSNDEDSVVEAGAASIGADDTGVV